MSAGHINSILKSIAGDAVNKTGPVYCNIIKNNFILLNEELTIPKIPVLNLSYTDALPIVQSIVPFIPLFLRNHTLLEQRNPAHEQHSIHFISLMHGTLIRFYHVFRIDFKFGGDSSSVLERGNNDYYPSFRTNRLYYKSTLVPTLQDAADSIVPIQLLRSVTSESDQYFHTYALFDDIDTSQTAAAVYAQLPDIFPVPVGLYPFIAVDYYTASLKVPNPTPRELVRAAAVYEPLFFIIASRIMELDAVIPYSTILSTWPDDIDTENGILTPREPFLLAARDYFKRYSLIRDDHCMVKGWWQFVIQPV